MCSIKAQIYIEICRGQVVGLVDLIWNNPYDIKSILIVKTVKLESTKYSQVFIYVCDMYLKYVRKKSNF